MVQTNKHNASMLTPVGRLYKQETMVNNKCLWSSDQKVKVEAESKKRNWCYLCSEGGRVELRRILILTKQIVKYKGVGAS